jgi:diaminohydroxyphosphoribosylaminopyrimidine deaminase / 5-amino-6-(5-phosphoribosylamino)uracil reductase
MSGTRRGAAEARDALQHPSHDISAMTLALALGRRGLGTCWPNPSVGALIADSQTGRIISGAWTGRGGRPHGEAIALTAAGEAARGATVYTTLEPCSHWGKTPPCADALARAGIKRLIYGAVDPDPRVAGRGLARLREHGIEVVEGPLPRQAKWLAIGHTLRVTTGRPFVQLKLALDADGRVPAGDGAPQFVTGEEARGLAHLLRAEADAILVGRGTVEADDPELTCRLPGLADRSPIRVVLSSQAILPLHAKMLRSAAAHPVWIIHAAGADVPQRAELERPGVALIPVEAGADGRADIRLAMQALAKRGITRVLAEGGPQLAESLSAANLIDEALIFRAPLPSRGASIAPFGPVGLAALERETDLELCHEKLVGADRLSLYRRAEFC